MLVCPTCGEVYGDDQPACRLDGTSLTPWAGTMPVKTPAAAISAPVDKNSPTRDLMASPRVALSPTQPMSDSKAAAAVAQVVFHPSVTAPLAGRVLAGRYALKGQLGLGGFGAVFEGEDQRLHKRVAIKVLSPQVAGSEDALERFRQEAIAASQIGHEGIVDVTDFDRDGDTSFIVMEFLKGRDLAALIQTQGPQPVARVLGIGAQVAFALHAAHRKDIIHRDLKPANIYLVERDSREDFVKVIDFGISKVMSQAARVGPQTSKGMILGTPHYMAPEQAKGDRDLDGRVDVYALGIILYEALTGEPPFQGETHYAVMAKHLNEPSPSLASRRPELAGQVGLDALIARALAKHPRDRFETIEDMGHEMVRLLETLDVNLANVVRPARRRSDASPRIPSPTPAPPPSVATRNLSPSHTLRQGSGELLPGGPGSSARPRGRLVWWAVTAAVATTIAGAALVLSGGGKERAAPVIPAAALAPEPEPEADAAPTPAEAAPVAVPVDAGPPAAATATVDAGAPSRAKKAKRSKQGGDRDRGIVRDW